MALADPATGWRWRRARVPTRAISSGRMWARAWTVTMPATAGTYQFRLYLNNGYSRAATSPDVTVIPSPPTVTSLSPASAVVGSGSLAVTVNGANFVSS